MKNFVKAMDKEGSGIVFLQEELPRISMEKLKAGIFDGPEIKELVEDTIFDKVLSKTELSSPAVTEVSCYKLPEKAPECGIRERN